MPEIKVCGYHRLRMVTHFVTTTYDTSSHILIIKHLRAHLHIWRETGKQNGTQNEARCLTPEPLQSQALEKTDCLIQNAID